jgi:hypothetical protein
MKKGFYVGLFIALVAAFILNLKKIEQPKKVEAVKQSVQTIAQTNLATVAPLTTSDLYRMLPDEIDFCGEHLLLDENRKQKLAGVLNEEIAGYTPDSIRKMITDNLWFTYFRKEPKNADFPEDLEYVPIPESQLNPEARSRKDAIGTWQFMADTAKRFGLRVEPENNYDERYDFVKSIEAAKQYLKELHEQFGNWPAALAAYNAGEEGLQKAMDREKTKDVFQLKTIKLETQKFPLRVLATKLIFTKPIISDPFLQKGWMPQSKYNNWEVIQVELKPRGRISINEIVQLLRADYPNLDYEQFTKYNKHILGDLEAGTYTAYVVRGPNGTS